MFNSQSRMIVFVVLSFSVFGLCALPSRPALKSAELEVESLYEYRLAVDRNPMQAGNSVTTGQVCQVDSTQLSDYSFINITVTGDGLPWVYQASLDSEVELEEQNLLGCLEVYDLNFDGYDDLLWMADGWGSLDNAAAHIWLYEPEHDVYNYSLELSYNSNPPRIDSAAQLLTFYTNGFYGSGRQTTYQFRDGEAQLLFTQETNDYGHVVIHRKFEVADGRRQLSYQMQAELIELVDSNLADADSGEYSEPRCLYIRTHNRYQAGVMVSESRDSNYVDCEVDR